MKYIKTEAGQTAFKTRSGALPTRLRSLFLLFDGKREVSEVMQMAVGLGFSSADVTFLVDSGLLARPADPATPVFPEHLPAAPVSAEATPAVPLSSASTGDMAELTPGQRYARALPIATQLTAELGLRGFRLNLAVEAAMGFDALSQLVPRIREAVGDEKVRPLEQALGLTRRA